MNTQVQVSNEQLTRHEAEQIRQIALWKSQPPNPLDEMSKMITLPWARFLERIVPDWIVTTTINGAYRLSRTLASPEPTKRKAGVNQLAELRQSPMNQCDRLAGQVAASARMISFVEGAVTGAGGVVTTVVDIPLLFVLSLRTIQKIGHCYGFTFDKAEDREYALGVLITATAGSLGSKRERLDRLHGLKDWFIEATQEEVIADELVSLLFQLELFEQIPGIGMVSGAVLNLLFSRKIDMTARRVFQERWLRDNGKVTVIEPAAVPHHIIARGRASVFTRAAHSASYYLGFGLSFPVCVVTALFRPVVT
jgi:EcsC protein family